VRWPRTVDAHRDQHRASARCRCRTSSKGRIKPGRVFDRVIGLDEVPDGYRAMNEREAMKVMIKP
jgi:threonine dehydrogenase-like Zn-dependent dehydrogenase